MRSTFLLSEFLTQGGYRPPPLPMEALVHGHCHRKAIRRGGPDHEDTLWEQMQLKIRPLIDGCCGMAGAFGFQQDNYHVSIKIAEHALLPAVRAASATDLIVADGFSCREQVAQLTDRQALHTAEVLQLALHAEKMGPGDRPESDIVHEHEQALRRSKIVTLAAVGGIALGAIFLALAMGKHRGGD
jgi:Fe-S oxidoreductase